MQLSRHTIPTLLPTAYVLGAHKYRQPACHVVAAVVVAMLLTYTILAQSWQLLASCVLGLQSTVVVRPVNPI